MPNTYGINNIELLKPIPDEHVVPVVITSGESVSTELTTFEVLITFAEPVVNFVIGSIVATNATLDNFDGSGREYVVEVTPTIAGDVTINVPAEVAKTRVGYRNSAAEEFSIEFVVV